MRDGRLRRSIKLAARGLFFANLRATRAIRRLRGEPRHRLGGRCECCAACCEAPGIQVGRVVWYWPAARGLFLWWHRAVNGFVLTGRDVTHRVFVFRCTHFDWQTRRCDSYGSRPGLCRDYPRALLYQPHPEFFPQCGHRPIACGAERFLAALEKEGLTPEQMDKIKRGLHLE